MRTSILTLFLIFVASVASAVPMRFLNKSGRYIPLEIPGVMNPNLSPFSSSGVDLAVGQKVYFFPKGKKGSLQKRILLLEVTEDLAGKDLVIDDLIKARKAELGL